MGTALLYPLLMLRVLASVQLGFAAERQMLLAASGAGLAAM